MATVKQRLTKRFDARGLAGAPLLGVPYALLALAALVVIALVAHHGRPVPDPV